MEPRQTQRSRRNKEKKELKKRIGPRRWTLRASDLEGVGLMVKQTLAIASTEASNRESNQGRKSIGPYGPIVHLGQYIGSSKVGSVGSSS
jgi:hypothetical protein